MELHGQVHRKIHGQTHGKVHGRVHGHGADNVEPVPQWAAPAPLVVVVALLVVAVVVVAVVVAVVAPLVAPLVVAPQSPLVVPLLYASWTVLLCLAQQSSPSAGVATLEMALALAPAHPLVRSLPCCPQQTPLWGAQSEWCLPRDEEGLQLTQWVPQ